MASVPRLCPNCKLPIDVVRPDGRVVSLFTRQGCEHCLRWESLPSEALLEWLPITEKLLARLTEDLKPRDVQEVILEGGGLPLGHRVLARAKEGALDGQEARDYLL